MIQIHFHVGVVADELHEVVWGTVRQLHEIDLTALCVIADGAKPNRKFFQDHAHKEGMKDGVVYKARNIYAPEKFVYFMPDVPHLIKTTQNCWEHSHGSGTRHLWVHQLTLYKGTSCMWVLRQFFFL